MRSPIRSMHTAATEPTSANDRMNAPIRGYSFANYIVEGSVRRIGNHVRVTIQLIDASNDNHLWANNYDRELVDVFATQSAIAREISDSIHLSKQMRRGRSKKRYTIGSSLRLRNMPRPGITWDGGIPTGRTCRTRISMRLWPMRRPLSKRPCD